MSYFPGCKSAVIRTILRVEGVDEVSAAANARVQPNDPWTTDEEEALRQWAQNRRLQKTEGEAGPGESLSALAARLGRRPGACKSRLKKMVKQEYSSDSRIGNNAVAAEH